MLFLLSSSILQNSYLIKVKECSSNLVIIREKLGMTTMQLFDNKLVIFLKYRKFESPVTEQCGPTKLLEPLL